MAAWMVVFLSCLLSVNIHGQEEQPAAAAADAGQTRFHQGGGFGGGIGGGFGGRPGGFPGGGGGRPGGFPGGVGGGGFGQQGFGGGFGQQGFGGGFGGQPGFIQPTGFPGGTVGHISGGLGTSNCRYWCKTPEGQAYCCESNQEIPNHPIASVIQKPGLCPPVRTECPLRIFGGPPQTCSKHGDCAGIDRCCFDRCLNEHVCKQPL